jgi:hypothetical protein
VLEVAEEFFFKKKIKGRSTVVAPYIHITRTTKLHIKAEDPPLYHAWPIPVVAFPL